MPQTWQAVVAVVAVAAINAAKEFGLAWLKRRRAGSAKTLEEPSADHAELET